MKKQLLTVVAISSLLAFNACKKGDQGPAGPAGPKGDNGAQGTAGATGKDGAVILAGDGAPAASLGKDGDMYFDKTGKSLYGPKASGAWGTGTVLSGSGGTGTQGPKGDKGDKGDPGAPGTAGPAGPKGDAGVAGTQFLSGTGAPSAATGNVGDYYFDTNTSIFYGPKSTNATTPWATNVFPLGTATAAKTYYLTVGLTNVKQVMRENSQNHTYQWGPVEISSSYYINADDRNRIKKYPGWGLNREMIFQLDPVGAPGVYNMVPQVAADLGASSDELAASPTAANTVGQVWARVGAKFRYTQNFTGAPNAEGGISSATQEFTLTQQDIDRLKQNGGASFNYLTYAAVDQSKVLANFKDGDRLEFHRTKTVQIKNLDDATATPQGFYHAQYSAESNLNLNTIAGLGAKLEKYKQDGKVFLKYRYMNPITGDPIYGLAGYPLGDPAGLPTGTPNSTTWMNGNAAGWLVADNYLTSYTLGGVKYGPGDVNVTREWPVLGNTASLHGVTVAGGGVQGFDVFNQGYLFGYTPGTTTRTNMSFGGYPHSYDIAANQNLTVKGIANNTIARSGVFKVNWDIKSGTNWANAASLVPFGPITLVNPNNSLNVVQDSWVGGDYWTGMYNYYNAALGYGDNTKPYWKDGVPANVYYKAPNELFGYINGTAVVAGHPAWANFLASNVLPEVRITDGKPASYFEGKPLLQVQVYVIPGDVVAKAKAAGVDVNNAAALSKFAESNQ